MPSINFADQNRSICRETCVIQHTQTSYATKRILLALFHIPPIFCCCIYILLTRCSFLTRHILWYLSQSFCVSHFKTFFVPICNFFKNWLWLREYFPTSFILNEMINKNSKIFVTYNLHTVEMWKISSLISAWSIFWSWSCNFF